MREGYGSNSRLRGILVTLNGNWNCLDPILKLGLFKQGFVAYFNPDIVFPRIRNRYLVNFIPDLISLDLRLPDPHR